MTPNTPATPDNQTFHGDGYVMTVVGHPSNANPTDDSDRHFASLGRGAYRQITHQDHTSQDYRIETIGPNRYKVTVPSQLPKSAHLEITVTKRPVISTIARTEHLVRRLHGLGE